jgi:hypothetical protein
MNLIASRTKACASILSVVLVMSGGVPARAQSAGPPRRIVQEVTNEEVKTFLDPTALVSRFSYSFGGNYLGEGIAAYDNTFRALWALNGRSALWGDVPVRTFDFSDRTGQTGVGDTRLGGGVITHEDLTSRLTTSILTFEASAPTGSLEKGTGVDAWILAPGGALAFNPTDVFPVYVIGKYLHSVGGLGGGQDGGEPGERLRSIELTIQTVHLLPKGVFLSAIPRFVMNLEQDFNFFSLGLGAGRALNRRIAVTGAYVQHVAGQRTFSLGFVVRLRMLFGERKDR